VSGGKTKAIGPRRKTVFLWCYIRPHAPRTAGTGLPLRPWQLLKLKHPMRLVGDPLLPCACSSFSALCASRGATIPHCAASCTTDLWHNFKTNHSPSVPAPCHRPLYPGRYWCFCIASHVAQPPPPPRPRVGGLDLTAAGLGVQEPGLKSTGGANVRVHGGPAHRAG
jgi:hypothetical protein